MSRNIAVKVDMLAIGVATVVNAFLLNAARARRTTVPCSEHRLV
jgi:hypothetical protein